jgi:hypothetical protein
VPVLLGNSVPALSWCYAADQRRGREHLAVLLSLLYRRPQDGAQHGAAHADNLIRAGGPVRRGEPDFLPAQLAFQHRDLMP